MQQQVVHVKVNNFRKSFFVTDKDIFLLYNSKTQKHFSQRNLWIDKEKNIMYLNIFVQQHYKLSLNTCNVYENLQHIP